MNCELLNLLEDLEEIRKNYFSATPNEKNVIKKLIDQIKFSINLNPNKKIANLESLLQQRDYRISEPFDLYNPLHLAYRRIAFYINPQQINSLLMPNIQHEDSFGNQFNDLLPGQFIISDDGFSFIDLESFFQSTFIRLKNGEKKFLQYIDANNKICNLSKNEKLKIISLLPSTREFFELADQVAHASKDSVLELFDNLRAALLAGDANHKGKEMDAGADANIGLVKFKTKYDLLSLQYRKKLGNLTTANGNTLNNIFQNLFKSVKEAKKKKLGVRYCLASIGRELECWIGKNSTELRKNFYDSSLFRLESCLNEINSLIEKPHFRLFALNQITSTKFLCQEKPDLLNQKDSQGKTLIDLAINAKQFSILPIDYFKDLTLANISNFIINNNFSVLKKALHFNPHFLEGKLGASILRQAILLRRTNMVKLLIDMNISINYQLEESPLELALVYNNFQIAQILLDGGAVITETSIEIVMRKENASVLSLFLTHYPEYINYQDQWGNTLLDKAIFARQYTLVEVLLENDAVITYKNVAEASSNENYNILNLLIAKYPQCLNFQDANKNTLLTNLINSKILNSVMFRIVKFLVNNGADVNFRSGNGLTPLELAIAYNNPSCCKILCEAHATVLPKHLIEAIKIDNGPVLTELLNSSILVNAKTENGDSLLDLAVKQKSVSCVKSLLDHNANMHHYRNGFFPIDHALQNHANEILVLLLKSGSPVPSLPIEEYLQGLPEETTILLKFVKSTGKNILPKLFKANYDCISFVINLINEIVNLKTFIHKQFDHRPDSSLKKNLLYAELNKLNDCENFTEFNNIVNTIRKLLHSHTKKGVAGFISFSWMKGFEGYNNFIQKYGKTEEKTDALTQTRSYRNK